jgi:hypothetical protein
VRDGFDLLLDWASRAVNLPLAFPSVHRLGAERATVMAAIWIVAGALMLVLLAAAMRRWSTVSQRWALTAGAGAMTVTVAVTASLRITGGSPRTPSSSQAAFLARWHPDVRPIVVRLPDGGTISPETALGAMSLRTSSRTRDNSPQSSSFALRRVPAGEYQVVVDGRHSTGDGGPESLSVSIGTAPLPVEQWPLSPSNDGQLRHRLDLPVAVDLLLIRADSAVASKTSSISISPQRLATAGPESGRVAFGAARYGPSRVFFLDDAAFVEPHGVWTLGNAATDIAVSHDRESSVEVGVMAGPVPTTVAFGRGQTVERAELQPGERRLIRLANGVWRVTTTGAFRPVDYEGGSRDARRLGARLEFQ